MMVIFAELCSIFNIQGYSKEMNTLFKDYQYSDIEAVQYTQNI